jgi:hypothetical protein
MTQPNWSEGVKRHEALSPHQMRRSAMLALERAKEWADTAERFLSKADDLERHP